jgi:hypothetical protein
MLRLLMGATSSLVAAAPILFGLGPSLLPIAQPGVTIKIATLALMRAAPDHLLLRPSFTKVIDASIAVVELDTAHAPIPAAPSLL